MIVSRRVLACFLFLTGALFRHQPEHALHDGLRLRGGLVAHRSYNSLSTVSACSR